MQDNAPGYYADAPFAWFGCLFKAGQGHLGDKAHEGCGRELFIVEELHHLRARGEPLDSQATNARATGEQEAEEDLTFCVLDGGDGTTDGAAVFAGRKGEGALGDLLRVGKTGEEQER